MIAMCGQILQRPSPQAQIPACVGRVDMHIRRLWPMLIWNVFSHTVIHLCDGDSNVDKVGSVH